MCQQSSFKYLGFFRLNRTASKTVSISWGRRCWKLSKETRNEIDNKISKSPRNFCQLGRLGADIKKNGRKPKNPKKAHTVSNHFYAQRNIFERRGLQPSMMVMWWLALVCWVARWVEVMWLVGASQLRKEYDFCFGLFLAIVVGTEAGWQPCIPPAVGALSFLIRWANFERPGAFFKFLKAPRRKQCKSRIERKGSAKDASSQIPGFPAWLLQSCLGLLSCDDQISYPATSSGHQY